MTLIRTRFKKTRDFNLKRGHYEKPADALGTTPPAAEKRYVAFPMNGNRRSIPALDYFAISLNPLQRMQI